MITQAAVQAQFLAVERPAAARPSASQGRTAFASAGLRRQQLHRIGARRDIASLAAQTETATTAAAPAAAAPAAAAPAAAAASGAAPAAFNYTSFEGNSFRVQFPSSDVSILVDPWLVGKLTFGGLDFVYAGSKRVAREETLNIDQIAAETDFIVLTQGIDDHAHRPTLQRLPKTIPVVASPAGAAVARSCGFRTVYELRAGQKLTLLDGRITIQGTAGALVGPPWSQRELGVVLRENLPASAGARGASLYYEPHADFVPESVARVAPVDAVVSPPCSQILMGYPLVKGSTDTVQLLKLLRPKVYIPLLNAEFDQSGPLADMLVEEGSTAEIQRQLSTIPELAGVQVAVPLAGTARPITIA